MSELLKFDSGETGTVLVDVGEDPRGQVTRTGGEANFRIPLRLSRAGMD
jgi:hypothetical protein